MRPGLCADPLRHFLATEQDAVPTPRVLIQTERGRQVGDPQHELVVREAGPDLVRVRLLYFVVFVERPFHPFLLGRLIPRQAIHPDEPHAEHGDDGRLLAAQLGRHDGELVEPDDVIGRAVARERLGIDPVEVAILERFAMRLSHLVERVVEDEVTMATDGRLIKVRVGTVVRRIPVLRNFLRSDMTRQDTRRLALLQAIRTFYFFRKDMFCHHLTSHVYVDEQATNLADLVEERQT